MTCEEHHTSCAVSHSAYQFIFRFRNVFILCCMLLEHLFMHRIDGLRFTSLINTTLRSSPNFILVSRVASMRSCGLTNLYSSTPSAGTTSDVGGGPLYGTSYVAFAGVLEVLYI